MLRILVIKLGALGDFVQAFMPFHAIRAHWPNAEITLLTTASFQALAEASPFFDRVLVDNRPRWCDLLSMLALRRHLRGYDLIVDLQTSGRSTRYFVLAGQRNWSGIARKGRYRHDNPYRDAMHSVARQRDQLARLGVPEPSLSDLVWLRRSGPQIEVPYGVLVPGAAPHRPGKRWPARHYGALAAMLSKQGKRIVIVGTATEHHLVQDIREWCPDVVDLLGQTDLVGLGGLFSRAAWAVGNDTGPMHLAAAVGCRSVVLFSQDSDPRLTAPVGVRPGQVTVLVVDDLCDLSVSRVAACLN